MCVYGVKGETGPNLQTKNEIIDQIYKVYFSKSRKHCGDGNNSSYQHLFLFA